MPEDESGDYGEKFEDDEDNSSRSSSRSRSGSRRSRGTSKSSGRSGSRSRGRSNSRGSEVSGSRGRRSPRPTSASQQSAGSSPDRRQQLLPYEMVKLVRPSAGPPGSVGEIWNKVMREGAKLPGNFEFTLPNTLDAARRGDWPLCAYLAAWCVKESGPSYLEEKDEHRCEEIWSEVVAPILVDVPAGDRKPTGGAARARSASADGRAPRNNGECFRPGATLQLAGSRIKRLKLEPAETADLRALLEKSTAGEKPAEAEVPPFMRRQTGLTYVSGGWFRVLAYPFLGDASKALLRPEARAWSPQQMKAARSIGETLISQCAKAKHWDMVDLLLRAGVKCPNLSAEFEGICGSEPLVQRQWRRDLFATVGYARRPYTLLEMAAWETPKNSPQFRHVLLALKETDQLPDLTGGKDSLPLVVAAGEVSRWDLVQTLLDEELLPMTIATGVVALMESPCIHDAPPDISKLVNIRSQQESTILLKTLKDYFILLLQGEVMTSEMLPARFEKQREQRHVLVEKDIPEEQGGTRILCAGLRLGCSQRAPPDKPRTVFVEVSSEEWSEALDAVDDYREVLPVNLERHQVLLDDPPPGSSGSYVVVCCPNAYLRKSKDGIITMKVPVNCIPTPNIDGNVSVSVAVRTPCCNMPLPNIPIHVSGRRMGATDKDGVLRCHLSVGSGRYMVSAPGYVDEEREVRTDQTDSNGELADHDIVLVSNGALYLYVQENEEDDIDDFVMLSGNLQHVKILEEGCKSFAGRCTLHGRTCIAGVAAEPAGRLVKDMNCGEQMKHFQVQPGSGKSFTINEAIVEWLDICRDECPLSLLYENPQRLGGLRKAPARRDYQGTPRSDEPRLGTGALWDDYHQQGAVTPQGHIQNGAGMRPRALRPRPVSACGAPGRPRAAQLRGLPQRPAARGRQSASQHRQPGRKPPPALCQPEHVPREGGCGSNPLFWNDYHDKWR